MITPDGVFPDGGGASPEEVRLASAQAPDVGDVPRSPAGASSTPGVSVAATRVPTAPTLPDPTPDLTSAVTALANQLFVGPRSPWANGAPVEPPGSGSEPTPPHPALVEPSFDDLGAHPPAPALASAASPPAARTLKIDGSRSPFDHPLDFGAFERAPQIPDIIGFSLLDAGAPSADTERERPVARGGAIDAHALKREFPILSERVHGKPLVWLDNAATTQKPRAVIDRISRFYEHENSNVHRAAHTLAARSTDAFEKARDSVRRFLGASSVEEIVFVRGATEGINLVAQSWGRKNLREGDEIVVTWLEHHANIVPWQLLASETGARLRVAPVDDAGRLRLDAFERLLGPRTKLVSVTHVSNALGTVNPVTELTAMAHRHGARVLVDGAQAVSHMPVDVRAIDCDFYVFSGHKVFGPTGIGAVYGKKEVLDDMPPWQGGGNMIRDVTFERTTFHGPPARFEAGTGNIADAVGLGAALDWLTELGLPRVAAHEHALLEYATPRLAAIPGLTLVGTAEHKAGVISFVLDGQKTEEVGGLLDKDGIAVRSGHHCAQPILRRFGYEATVRASFAPYNTLDDVDALVDAVRRLQSGGASRS